MTAVRPASTSTSLVLFAATVLLLARALPAAAHVYHNPQLLDPESIQLGNGDSAVIADDKTKPHAFRICVHPAYGDVPLRVTTDAREQVIGIGQCANVSGYDVSIAPAGPLKGHLVLGAEFKRALV